MQKVTVTIDTGCGHPERIDGLCCLQNTSGIKLKEWQCEGRKHKGFIILPWSHVIKVEEENE